MEALASYSSSLRFPSLPPSPSLFNRPPKFPIPSNLSFPKSRARNQPLHLAVAVSRERKRKRSRHTSIMCSSKEAPSWSSSSSEIWLLDPVDDWRSFEIEVRDLNRGIEMGIFEMAEQQYGDGDSRHIGYKVPLPGALEIVSDVITVGRVPEKADLVIPVATVSGLHARLQKKEGNLLITDLDSTNGTFVDEKRLRPGAVVPVPPGSCITFGDIHLAMFRVSKVEAPAESPATGAEESGTKLDADVPYDNLETVS